MNINTKFGGSPRLLIWLMFLASVAFFSPRNHAATITLQDGVNGYTGGASTHIRSDNPAINYNNYSVPAGSQLIIGDTGSTNGVIRGLYSFNLGTLPSNITINSVAVKLTIDVGGSGSGTAFQVDLMDLNRSFTETTATWNTYDGTNAWTTAGGDFGSLLASTNANTNLMGGSILTFSAATMVSSLQNAINTSSAFNFMVKISNEVPSVRDILFLGGDTDATISYRPSITIDYTVVPEPTTVTMLMSGLALLVAITAKKKAHQGRSTC